MNAIKVRRRKYNNEHTRKGLTNPFLLVLTLKITKQANNSVVSGT